jgi:hypothetical protein
MPTGSEYGDDRVMRPPQEAGTHGWRPWSGDMLCVRIAKETYYVPTRNDTKQQLVF